MPQLLLLRVRPARIQVPAMAGSLLRNAHAGQVAARSRGLEEVWRCWCRDGGRCLCPWENVGLPCPPRDREHYYRHCHRVCAYCYVEGHTLTECTLAKKDGLPVGVLHFCKGQPQPVLGPPTAGRSRRL